MEIIDVTIYGVGAVPLVIALTELVKRTFPQIVKHAPVVSMALGVILMGLAQGFVTESIANGIFIGLAASGLFSGAKKIAGM